MSRFQSKWRLTKLMRGSVSKEHLLCTLGRAMRKFCEIFYCL